jgi:molecular chaperone DnaK (HSP70)
MIGIDLGTTNSVVAAINRHGRPEVIPNREGASLTPSVIYFGVSPPVVGAEAREYARLGDDQVASQFKPQMGNPHFALRFGGKDHTATDLSAIVLERLKEDCEARLQRSIDRAVVTVPAYFGEAQRSATIEAARRAGLRVARLINEPTAAALAYGMHRAAEEETVLVYDLGGGTFDVTIVRIAPGEITVLATAGDHDLGGRNWDERIASWLAERFAADTGIDPLDDPASLGELLTRSEQAKWGLSERSATRITLQFAGERRTYELARGEFEAMSRPLLERTGRLVDEALAEARIAWPDVGGVLLVGGSTRMPMVRELVAGISGRPARAGVNVDEVVALGAAVQAALDAGSAADSALPGFTLAAGERERPAPRYTLPSARVVRDVMSHSLGAIAVAPDGSRYVNDRIISRNVPIPARASRSYLHETHGGENRTLELYLTQGESEEPRDCTILGKYVFEGIEPTAAEVAVDIGVSYDANGRVQVEAVQRDTGRRLAMRVEGVPDDLGWLERGPERRVVAANERLRIYLMIDVSSSMAGPPLEEARRAARAFLDQCDMTHTEVGLISFSNEVVLQAEATSNVRRLQAAISRLEADGTTNLSEALNLARRMLGERCGPRYIVILTDGYPDAAEAAFEEARAAQREGLEIVAIGTGEADKAYLGRLASTEAGTIFARRGELVATFGHIARVIAEGGRGLRLLG